MFLVFSFPSAFTEQTATRDRAPNLFSKITGNVAAFDFRDSKAVLEQLFILITEVRLCKEKGLQQWFV
jgi:hypothetical protein